MSFKVGDRVKIPNGIEGTVRHVGKVQFASGIHLGVELDKPAGDNNGKKKGKRYFSCKKKHGIIEKTSYFTTVKQKGKKGSKRKSIKASSSAPQITTETKSIQTDAPKDMLAYVESEYYCKVITRLYTEENEKLRKQRDDAISVTISLQQRTDLAEAKAKQLEYEIKQQNIELDPLREKLEMREVENEELNIKFEIALIEIEELNEKLVDNLDEYVSSISSDKNEQAQLIATNKELQQQLGILTKVAQELLDTKDKRINSLSTESDYVDSLLARLKDLLVVERQVLGLKTEVRQLKDKCIMLEDADRMCRELTEYNNQLEGELIKENNENKELQIEKQHLHNEIFELTNKINRNKYNFAPVSNVIATDILNNSNDKTLKLQLQLEQIRGILMRCINDNVEGQGHYVQYELIKQYLLPDSLEVDYGGIHVLTLMHKILWQMYHTTTLDYLTT